MMGMVCSANTPFTQEHPSQLNPSPEAGGLRIPPGMRSGGIPPTSMMRGKHQDYINIITL
jgi:hypothetical protein